MRPQYALNLQCDQREAALWLKLAKYQKCYQNLYKREHSNFCIFLSSAQHASAIQGAIKDTSPSCQPHGIGQVLEKNLCLGWLIPPTFLNALLLMRNSQGRGSEFTCIRPRRPRICAEDLMCLVFTTGRFMPAPVPWEFIMRMAA